MGLFFEAIKCPSTGHSGRLPAGSTLTGTLRAAKVEDRLRDPSVDGNTRRPDRSRLSGNSSPSPSKPYHRLPLVGNAAWLGGVASAVAFVVSDEVGDIWSQVLPWTRVLAMTQRPCGYAMERHRRGPPLARQRCASARPRRRR